jgi:predicted MFS family arabinose efflux permease
MNRAPGGPAGSQQDGGAGRTQRGLLRTGDFALLWTGESTSTFGSAITTVALPLVAVGLHASTLTVASLTAAVWLPWLALGLPAGAWVERWPRRPVMLLCDGICAVALTSVAVASWCGVLTITQLLAVALLEGGCSVFFNIAYQSYLPALVSRDQLVPANTMLQTSASAAQFAGPGLGGLIAQLAGAVSGLAVDSGTFLVSAACLLRIRTRETPPTPHEGSIGVRDQVLEGLSFIRHDPYLRTLTVLTGVENMLLMGVQALRVVFLASTVGLPAGAVGAAIGVGSAGGVLGAMATTLMIRRFGSARTLLLAEVATAPFGLLIPLAGRGWLLMPFVLGSLVVIGGIAMANVVINSFRQSYVPPRLISRVTATSRLVIYGTIPIGALIGGALGTLIGVRTTMWLLVVLYAVAPLSLLATPIRHDRELPTREPEPDEAQAQRA